MPIETTRLRLRPAEEKDIPYLVSGLNDWTVAQWLISAPYPYAEADAHWFINWTNTADETGFNGKFVIADRKTDEFLGVVTLLPENGRAELGYWLLPTAQKNGYMKEAVAGVIAFARREAPSLTCFATIDPANLSSEKCLRANGFQFANKYKREKCRRNGTVDTTLYELSLSTGGQFLIRLAEPTDVPLLAEVERSAAIAFQVLPDFVPNDRTVPQELLTDMANSKKLWVAINGAHKPIGFIGCRDMDNILYVHEISVAHEFQKQGIGRQLMLTVLNEAIQKGYVAIGLTTRRDAAWNMPFYKTLGFYEIIEAHEYPMLRAQLQKEYNKGATPDTRLAMAKRLTTPSAQQEENRH